MFISRLRVRWLRAAPLAVGLLSFSLAAPATAAPAAPSAALLRQQVRQGTLLAAHGVRPTCPTCAGLVVTRSKTDARPLSTNAPVGYGATDLARAYHVPAGNGGARTTIAIIDAGVDPRLEHDLGVYRSQYGLPACTRANSCLRLLNYDGGPQPAPPTSVTGRGINEAVGVETSLDMDAASAGCPSCRLLEISLPWQDAVDDNDVSTGDFARAVRTAVANGVGVVSISYGFTADDRNTSGVRRTDLDRPGVAIVASTGDSGYNGGVHQTWPANLPSVVAVGGTTLYGDGHETSWAFAGSGCETRFRSAHGQPASVTRLCSGHRAASDISADADPNTGLAVYDTYAPASHDPPEWIVLGGTSASAPFIGGLFGRAGDLAPVDGPRTLYAAPAADLTDVITGESNSQSSQCSDDRGVSRRVCVPGAGWDGPTGRGTPNGLGAFRPSTRTIASVVGNDTISTVKEA